MASEKDLPVVEVGEKIKFQWEEEAEKTRTIHARVIGVKKSSKRKHGSHYKYELCLYKENNASFSTRLINLPWEKKESSKRKAAPVDEEPPAKLTDATMSTKVKPAVPGHTAPASSALSTALTPESLRHIVAPMVGGSELAFRLLCRKYGATLAYTPMMSSERFAVDAEYRKAEFQTTPEDRPLVAHFSANNPKMFLEAAKHVQDQCDAIGEWAVSVILAHVTSLLLSVVLVVRGMCVEFMLTVGFVH